MRALSTKRLAWGMAAGAVAAVAVLLLSSAAGSLALADALGLSTVIVALGGLAVTLLALRWTVRRMTVVTRRLTAVDERLTAAVPALTDRLDRLSGEVGTGLRDLARTGAADYRQLEAYIDLRSLVRPRAPLPALRGWAASPDVLHFLAETMMRRRPKLVVECGSGSSSVWLGYLAEQIGARVVCLEHDERYGQTSRDLIAAHDLSAVVEIRDAPLTDWKLGGEVHSWYDRAALENLTGIGLLFVDGPPGTIGPEARYPAVPLLLPRCDADAVIVLDDADRAEEIALSDRWLAEHPEIERSILRYEKGAHVLTRSAT
jgi:predicted O-methyltransferase YrrM